jgi:hypothetical protein
MAVVPFYSKPLILKTEDGAKECTNDFLYKTTSKSPKKARYMAIFAEWLWARLDGTRDSTLSWVLYPLTDEWKKKAGLNLKAVLGGRNSRGPAPTKIEQFTEEFLTGR